jgi:hypothetical protein
MTRKVRSDRTHIIYVITNVLTEEQYIGLTAKTGTTVKRSLHRRMQKHLQRAMTEDKGWGLCESLRFFGPEAFTYGVLEILRGKKEAHARETELIKELNPALNTFK